MADINLTISLKMIRFVFQKNDYEPRDYEFYRLWRLDFRRAEFHFEGCKENKNHQSYWLHLVRFVWAFQ